MKWLITGGCGFIGTRLIQRLSGKPEHSLRVLDNLTVGSREDLSRACSFVEIRRDDLPQPFDPARVQLVCGDILDEELTGAAGKGADVIVHLAANTGVEPSVQNPRKDCLANVIGTLNCLESARHHGVKRFVFASSGAPVGECEPPIHENLAPHPVSPYGASKLAGEGYCSAYFRTFGVETVALRFGNVYGPGSTHKSSVVAKFLRQALRGEALVVNGDGSQTRDFLYIDDLVDAVCLASSTPGIGGEIFQIATGSETSIREILGDIEALIQETGLNFPGAGRGQWRAGDVKRNFSDISKATRILGWNPQTSRLDGLKRTFDWFRALS